MSLIFNRKKTEPKTVQLTEKPWVSVVQNYDVDAELESTPSTTIANTVDKKGNVEQQIQLVAAGNVYTGVSIEDALSRGYGAPVKYFDYYKSTGVLRKCINMTGNFTTRAGFETAVKCLDDKDNPEKKEYLDSKNKIDTLNRKVNLDHVLKLTEIKVQIYGNCGWEIVYGEESGEIVQLKPLRSAYMIPQIDPETGDFSGIKYSGAIGDWIPKERLLYFNMDDLENSATSLLGVSSVRSIERNIKIKKNLERDLLYAARSLWAPIVIYQADTRGLTPAEKATLFTNLKQDLRPGAIVVTNRQVNATVTQYNPDLNNLIRAMEKQDEEIIGNYGIPKALLSREKTMARATLEFSIRAFYESTIAGEQSYLGRQLEKQWYDPIIEAMGQADKIRIRHEWRPLLDPASDLIVALVRAFDAGVISGEEFFRRLGWQLDRVEREAAPQTGGEDNE